MTGTYQFDAVDLPGAFASLGEAWRELLAGSEGETIFLTPEWMESWWTAYGAGRRGTVVTVRRGGSLVALVPLQVAKERWRGAWTLRTLRFLSDGTYDADYLDVIAAPGTASSLVPELWRWLQRTPSLRFDLARWNEIPAASSTAGALDEVLRRDNSLYDEERVGAVIAALPTTWEEYLAALKPRMRTKLRSLRRDLEAAHQVRLLPCLAEPEIEPRLESLFDLHQRRWSGKGGVFGADRKRAFYRALTPTLLRRGWLHFYSLEVDGAFVAHQYCMGYRGTTFLLQEGYDPVWTDQGVGNVLRAMVLERLIGEAWSAYDFLAGVTEHKRSWGGTVKESVRLFARGPSFAGGAIAALERTVRARRAAATGAAT